MLKLSQKADDEMKSLFCIILLLFSNFLISCGHNKQTDNVILPYPPVIVWENKAYVFTDIIVPADELGNKIGEVKRYVDPTKHSPEKNGDSTLAQVGSSFFEIKGLDPKRSFAVELNGKCIKVEYYEP